MKQRDKIYLIGNYAPDKQESMKRFAAMMQKLYVMQGYEAIIIEPAVVFGKLSTQFPFSVRKYIAYIDKFFVFPLLLLMSRLGRKGAWYHVCDHSNALYMAVLPSDNSVITCHDVLAIRGALGHKEAYCEATSFGRLLQKIILYFLVRSRKLAAVSQTTLDQLKMLVHDDEKKGRNWRLIYNSFNAPFSPDPVAKERQRRYIFHIGSNLDRKNRKLIVQALALVPDPELYLYLAGQPMDDKLERVVQANGLENRVINIAKPDHSQLVELYRRCTAMVFPSYSEGFGWPIIEAQASGAPVITSRLQPMMEVSGEAALFVDPDDPKELKDAIMQVGREEVRTDLILNGLKNTHRFLPEEMVQEYLGLLFDKRTV
jgi:glycosyltransferase involved in cell wall biosynthesis